MKEQVLFMQDDWKHEQQMTMNLGKDLKFKEEQFDRAQEANAGQAAMIA